MEFHKTEKRNEITTLSLCPIENNPRNENLIKNTQKIAVLVQNAKKEVANNEILKGLNMTIQKGTIYSLLGCSGCGKTTTLSCIVGLDSLTSGKILLFGEVPGSKEVCIPGKNIGYMPQEYALLNEFTIWEVFMYFGILNGMEKFVVFNAISFFTDLLNLPNCYTRIENLSGGQKRRVSFAISLQHNPDLLVLDEPTVGLDPLLRERIWNHLQKLTRTKSVTVLITTHYIEEARRSDVIGVMNGGKLIAENNPFTLMKQLETNSLEKVVLQMTKMEQLDNSIKQPENLTDEEARKMCIKMAKTSNSEKPLAQSLSRVQAMTLKNWRQAVRNITIFGIAIVLPAMSLLCGSIGYGMNLTNLNFGVVNDELANLTCTDLVDENLCNLDYPFSCRYLKELTDLKVFNLVELKGVADAKNAVINGEIWGFIHFPVEFSWYFYERAVFGVNPSDLEEVLKKSTITVHLDQSSRPAVMLISKELFNGFGRFVRNILKFCKYPDPELATRFGLVYHNPVMGHNAKSFSDYVIPTFFNGLVFFWSIISTGIRYVNEKQDGTLNRALVAGVCTWEIMLSYSLIELVIGIARILIIYFFIFSFFNLKIIGPIWLSFVLGMSSSYAGACAGFTLGSLCSEEIQVALLTIALFLPNFFINGALWPVEGMPEIMQQMAPYMPGTLSGEAMRSVLIRGWGMDHQNVWIGFLANAGHSFVYIAVALIGSKWKSI